MLRMKDGSSKRTGPAGGPPRRVSETERPDDEMLTPIAVAPVVGKLLAEIGCAVAQPPGGHAAADHQ